MENKSNIDRLLELLRVTLPDDVKPRKLSESEKFIAKNAAIHIVKEARYWVRSGETPEEILRLLCEYVGVEYEK